MIKHRQIPIDKVLKKIEQADDYELSEITKAVVRRYNCMSPDWEVVFLSLSKNNPEGRKNTLKLILDFLIGHSP